MSTSDLVEIFYNKYSEPFRIMKNSDPRKWEELKQKEKELYSKSSNEVKKLSSIIIKVIDRIEEEDNLLRRDVWEFDPVLSGLDSFMKTRFIKTKKQEIKNFTTKNYIVLA